jgi:hypothetical protein
MNKHPVERKVKSAANKSQKSKQLASVNRKQVTPPEFKGSKSKSLSTVPKSKPKQPASVSSIHASRTERREGISSPAMNIHSNRSIVRNHVQRDLVYIGSLTGKNGLLPGDLMYVRRNRASLPGSYLQPLSGMYTRWRVRRQRYIFKPSIGSTFSGQIILAQDPDPVSTYNDNNTSIQSLSVLVGCQIKQVWQEISCDIPRTKEHDNLFTQDVDTALDDYTERFSSAGNFFAACVAVGDMGRADVTIGSLWLEYDYEFYEPRLQLNLQSDPSLILSNIGVDLMNRITASVTSSSDGPGILTTLMNLMNDVTLNLPLIQVLYDAVVTFFDYLPWEVFTLSSKLLRNGSGVFPTDLPGVGLGHYSTECTIWMKEGPLNAIKANFVAAPPAGDGSQICINTVGGTPGLYDTSRWFFGIPVDSGSVLNITSTEYVGGHFVYTAGTQTWFANDVFNPGDGQSYSGKWIIKSSFVNSQIRGYGDMNITVSNFGYTTPDFITNIRLPLTSNADNGNIRIDWKFSNKDSDNVVDDIKSSPSIRKRQSSPTVVESKSIVPDKRIRVSSHITSFSDPFDDDIIVPPSLGNVDNNRLTNNVHPPAVRTQLLAASVPVVKSCDDTRSGDGEYIITSHVASSPVSTVDRAIKGQIENLCNLIRSTKDPTLIDQLRSKISSLQTCLSP